MSRPRAIDGTTGSRIRVILGENGSEWLLLLDNDDGNVEWQSHHFKRIPDALSKQIGVCSEKGRQIEYIDFDPNGSWYVFDRKTDGSGGHGWFGGLDSEGTAEIEKALESPYHCEVALGSNKELQPSLCTLYQRNEYNTINSAASLHDRLKQNHGSDGTVHMIRLFSRGQYYIEDDQGMEWSVLPNNSVERELRKNEVKEDVAIAGDGSWIIIREETFVCGRGIDSELTDKIRGFFTEQSERRRRREREIEEAAVIEERRRYFLWQHEVRYAASQAELAEELQRVQRFVDARAEQDRQRSLEQDSDTDSDADTYCYSEGAAERAEEEEEANRAAKESKESTFEVKLVEKLTQEKESIDKLATQLGVMRDNLGVLQDSCSTMQDDLDSRKRSLRESVEALPPAQRPRWNLEEDKPSRRQEKPQCVICQVEAPVRAVVPCGHVCLCDNCAVSISERESNDRLCPLCRGPVSSTLRIYM